MNAKAIVLNVTRYVSAEFIAQHRIKAVYQTFVFNPDSAIHCCEITSSYELEPVSFDIDAGENSESAWDACCNDGSFWPEVEYVHCSVVDSGRYGVIHDLGDGWDSLDEAREYVQGNPVS